MFNKMIVGYGGSEGSRAALIHSVDLMLTEQILH